MADVAAGRFREDLFQRLAVGILRLPPLRDRPGDIDLLIDHFLDQINAEGAGKPEAQRKTISVDGKKVLLNHPWPGNVRELYHTLLRAVIWSPGAVISADDARSALLKTPTRQTSRFDLPITQGFDLEGLLDAMKRHYVEQALQISGGNKSAAAKLLGLASHQTLNNWMKRLGVESAD
jgi:DNA-binding NtrC family response regulator